MKIQNSCYGNLTSFLYPLFLDKVMMLQAESAALDSPLGGDFKWGHGSHGD